jgi:glycerol-3-phosphate acyltransferase PlsY
MTQALLVVAGYLSGSVPFGVLVTRLARGVDVRGAGSGNIGATNVARVAGKKLGALVLVLDALKGAFPVVLAMTLVPEAPRLHAAVGLAAFLGHVFPVWLKLRGGKGVATALGVLGVLVPWAALSGAAVWLLCVLVLRVSSVGSLAGGAVAVGVAFYTASPAHDAYALLTAGLFGMMLFTHRGNIGRLLRRSERKL